MMLTCRNAYRCLLLVVLPACGAVAPATPLGSTDTLHQDIIGGQDGGSPQVGLLLIQKQQGGSLCSGTLLTPTVVLTAAHCATDSTSGRDPNSYLGSGAHITFLRGDNPLGSDAMPQPTAPAVAVMRSVVHPKFRYGICANPQTQDEVTSCNQGLKTLGEACGAQTTSEDVLACVDKQPLNLQRLVLPLADTEAYDFALMFLQEPITDLLPALPLFDGSPLQPGVAASIVGYGMTENPRDVTANSPMSSGAKHQGTTDVEKVFATEMQTGNDSGVPEPGPRVCHGDSGGPLFVTDPNGQLRLAGVVSRGEAGLETCANAIFGRVDTIATWLHDEAGLVVPATHNAPGNGTMPSAGGAMVPSGGAPSSGSAPQSNVASDTEAAGCSSLGMTPLLPLAALAALWRWRRLA